MNIRSILREYFLNKEPPYNPMIVIETMGIRVVNFSDILVKEGKIYEKTLYLTLLTHKTLMSLQNTLEDRWKSI